jgi:serine/threonine-protein kinase HipA
MAAERLTVEVVADWVGLGGPVRVGVLHGTPLRGKEIFAFEYDKAWLATAGAFAIDPALRLYQGWQHAPSEGWRAEATHVGIHRAEQDRMARAFRIADEAR